jgi:hypothetical protein
MSYQSKAADYFFPRTPSNWVRGLISTAASLLDNYLMYKVITVWCHYDEK